MQATEILVPVSAGELLDKVTILNIKSQRITDAGKLANVNKELHALRATCASHGLDLGHALVGELQKINEMLWDVEDALREKERRKMFDDEFIRMARAVYYTNDKRAAVKKEINLLMGSAFVEEKSYQAY